MAEHFHLRDALARMFSPSLLVWLRERGCTCVQFEGSEDCEDHDATFIFPLASSADGHSAGQLLFYGLQLCDGEEQLLRNLLQASDQMQTFKRPESSDSSASEDVCIVSCRAAAQLLHDIRNRLNSLLMSAGVLYTAPASAELTKRFATQIEADGKSCAEELSRLCELFRTPTSADTARRSGKSKRPHQVARQAEQSLGTQLTGVQADVSSTSSG